MRVSSRCDDREPLEALATSAAIRALVAVVVAHPDDETIAMGGRLPMIEDLVLIQLTDGSPCGLDDARRAGYDTREDYAAAREGEALLALLQLGLMPRRRIRYGARDQDAYSQLGTTVEALARDLREAEIVITHPYEGGHPDHDTASCAVQFACDAIETAGGCPPLRLEFASYHSCDGERQVGRFWPDPERPEVVARLAGPALARKRAALDCYRSQSNVIAWFDPDIERYRRAPRYDFSAPPPPTTSLYDSFGWPLTSAEWRRRTGPPLSPFARERT